MNKLVKKTIIYTVVLIFIIFYVWLCKNGYGLKCPFYTLFKIRCFGCGATTCALALLRLDFVSAFKANALFCVVIYPAIAFLMIQDYINAILCFVKKYDKKSLLERLFHYTFRNNSKKNT
ncbi:MAG: DUF2752 domain-containing protein [Oscillospiraceae bacterium]